MQQQSSVNTKNLLKFILCSAFGILMFLVPIPQGESFTTLLDFLKTALKNLLGTSLDYILLILLIVSAVVSLIDYIAKPEFIRKNHYLKRAFSTTPFYLVSKILGAVFGICSLISNTMAPTLLSFAFSPFMSTTGIVGAIKAIWISVGCRVLIGVAAGWLWILLNKLKVNQTIALPIVGFAGSMVNTITVMGSIYLLFAQQYAEAKEVAITAVWGLVMGTVTASGIPEAIAAAILVLAVGKVLIGVFRRMNIGTI